MAVSCIRLENVIKTYDRQIVLDVESCSLACGNVYGLVGTNGVGKTTLLEILYGSVAPDHGKVDLGGMKVEMVHHSSGLFQEMKVFENM